jgi:group I intron endonuclease
MTCGVYQIFIEDYCYWGSSGNCEKRCSDHLNSLKRGNHQNKKMQAVFNKYKTFDWQIIVACDDRDVAYLYEQDYIDAHFGLDKCMNLNAVASKPPSQKGKKHTAETKSKMSAAKKGHTHTAETRAKQSAGAKGNTNSKGYKHSDETRAKMSASGKGHPVSDETKANMSAAQKNAPKFQCPHCLSLFAAPALSRWHGDNCKKKLQQVENNPEISQDAEYIRLSAQS